MYIHTHHIDILNRKSFSYETHFFPESSSPTTFWIFPKLYELSGSLVGNSFDNWRIKYL